MIAFKHRQVTYGWEVIMGQTVRPANADYPVIPDFDPLGLDHLVDPYAYFPRFREGVCEEDQG